jgi:hypothetical protein
MKTNDKNEQNQPLQLHDVVCCDSFIKFIPHFGWMKTDDKIFLMPYIKSGELLMRINHCPSCGKYVRDIQISQEEILSIIS